jgi:potassium/hydrogen antiporter
MVALCIILFTGGMDTKMEDIRPVLSPGVMLATSGVFLTTLFCGLFVYWVSGWQLHTGVGFTLIGSLLLAATMSSTDSASFRERQFANMTSPLQKLFRTKHFA